MTPPPGPLAPREARILICDDLSSAALDVFRERGLEPVVCTGLSEDELVERVTDAHALIVRSATKITRRVLEAAPQLRVVGRAGVGVDNVDCATATTRGVVVMNTPTGNTTTTGELAIALMCSLSRHICRADRQTRSGKWGKKGLLGTELTGKRLGVIGLGRIGRVVADRAVGLKMEVVAHDPYLQGAGRPSPIEGVELVDLEQLIETCDFLTLHVPLLDSTKNLLSRERLERTKRGVRIINAARGGLIDEVALADLLESGHVAGAALDVLAQEPPPADHPLLGREDVILTPHLGASSHEAQHNVAVGIARQISEFLLDGVAHNAVNAPAVPAKTLQAIAPYVTLGERMGAFLAQQMGSPVRKLEVTLSESLERDAAQYLPLSILVGVLRQSDGSANYVNSPLLAKEQDVRLLQGEKSDTYSFQNLIKVRATSRGGEESHVISGTVFGRSPRIVRIDGLHLDLDPTGTILMTSHHDRPGVIGELGGVLGAAGVNIRRMEMGTGDEAEGQLAAGFLSLDEDPGEEVMHAVEAISAIERAQLIRLGS